MNVRFQRSGGSPPDGRVVPGLALTHHSDRGRNNASADCQAPVESCRIRVRTSRHGECWNSGAVESFFGIVKKELVSRLRSPARTAARAVIFDYIEVFYNRERLHSSLGYVSPVDYARQLAVTEAAKGVHENGGGSERRMLTLVRNAEGVCRCLVKQVSWNASCWV